MYIFGDVTTCYYGGVDKLIRDNPRRGLFLVQTSNSKPPSFKVDYNWETSHPGWDLVNKYKANKVDKNQYTKIYGEIVLHNKWGILLEDWKEIVKMAKGKMIVLLCWEPTGFCHRELLIDFLFEEGLIFAVLNRDVVVSSQQYDEFSEYEQELEQNLIMGHTTYAN